MKYEIGDSLRINIKGYTEDIAANVDNDGNVDPIKLYIIGSTEDGKPRYISEEVLDGIVQMGADVYKVTETPMREDDKDDLVEIGDLKPGTTIEVGGIQMEILDDCFPSSETAEGVFCLAKDILFKKAFDEDNCNNWAESSLRIYLNGKYKNEIESKIGEGALMPFERDLISDDGMKNYCLEPCIDKVSLISHDEYKIYRDYIGNKSDWWWTLTPYSCSSGASHYARLVNSDGSLNNYDADSGYNGVSPAFSLLSTVTVSDSTDSDGCYTLEWNAAPTISTASDSLGDKNAAFSVDFAINDADSDAVSAVVKLDGTTKQTIASVTLGATNTFTVDNTTFRSLAAGSHTIQIVATDSHSASTTKNITFQRTVSTVTLSGTDGNLGNKWITPEIVYQVSDTNSTRVDIVEKIDGTTTNTITDADLDTDITFDMSTFSSLGSETSHTLTITATNEDSQTATRTWTFTKLWGALAFYTNAVATDAAAKKINVVLDYEKTGNPTVMVEVTNDACAIQATWEDATAAVLAGEAYEFTNEPEEDFGIAVRVTVTKSASTERVYVYSLGYSIS